MGPSIEHSFRKQQIRESGSESQSQPTSPGDPTETLWSEHNTSKEPSSRYDIGKHESTTSVKERTAAFERRENESTIMMEKEARGSFFREHLPDPEAEKANARQFQIIRNWGIQLVHGLVWTKSQVKFIAKQTLFLYLTYFL